MEGWQGGTRQFRRGFCRARRGAGRFRGGRHGGGRGDASGGCIAWWRAGRGGIEIPSLSVSSARRAWRSAGRHAGGQDLRRLWMEIRRGPPAPGLGDGRADRCSTPGARVARGGLEMPSASHFTWFSQARSRYRFRPRRVQQPRLRSCEEMPAPPSTSHLTGFIQALFRPRPRWFHRF